jgi:site-specific DNA recombinase
MSTSSLPRDGVSTAGGHARPGKMHRVRRAVIYVRISDDREGKSLGIKRQEKLCREEADRRGWDVLFVRKDNDISAYSGKPRPGYKKMLNDIETGMVDAVLTYHTDRLYRRPKELEGFIDVVEAAGDVEVQTVRGGIIQLDSSHGRAMARVAVIFASLEIERLQERLIDKMDEKAANGEWRGGQRPYGYEADGMTIRPPEAKIVKELTHRIIEGERNTSALARELNARGVMSATGLPWNRTTIQQVVKRGRNAGLVEQGRTGNTYKAKWKAIITEPQWRTVCMILSDPSRVRNGGSDGRLKHLGSSLYVCGTCGQKMTASTAYRSRSDRTRVHVYKCGGAMGQGYKEGSQHNTRHMAPVDAMVNEAVHIALSSGYAREAWLRNQKVLNGGSAVDVQAEIARLTEEINAMGALKNAGKLSLTQVVEMSEHNKLQIRRLQATMGEETEEDPLTGIIDASDPCAAFDAAPLSKRRAIIDRLYTVTIFRSGRGRFKHPDPNFPFPYFDPSLVKIERKIDVNAIAPVVDIQPVAVDTSASRISA